MPTLPLLPDALVVAHEHALWAAMEGQGPADVMRSIGYVRTDLPCWQVVVEVLAMRAMTLCDLRVGKSQILEGR